MNHSSYRASAQFEVFRLITYTSTATSKHNTQRQGFPPVEMLSYRHNTTRKQSTRRKAKAQALRKEDLIVSRRETQHTHEKGTRKRASNRDPFRAIRIDDTTKYRTT